MKSTVSRNSAKSEVAIPQFVEFNEQIVDEFYEGNCRRYYGFREAFLSIFMCWRIKKSYGLIKDTIEKTRRFKKDIQMFEKEIDIIKIISGMSLLLTEQKSNILSKTSPVSNLRLNWFKLKMQRIMKMRKKRYNETLTFWKH